MSIYLTLKVILDRLLGDNLIVKISIQARACTADGGRGKPSSPRVLIRCAQVTKATSESFRHVRVYFVSSRHSGSESALVSAVLPCIDLGCVVAARRCWQGFM